MNFYFYTLGCKVNQYESQMIGELLSAAGHTVVNELKDANAVIINSCTVTAESDRKTRQSVRRFKRALGGGLVLLTGCMPQAFPADAEALAEADIVTGNATPEKIPSLVEKSLKTGERIVRFV